MSSKKVQFFFSVIHFDNKKNLMNFKNYVPRLSLARRFSMFRGSDLFFLLGLLNSKTKTLTSSIGKIQIFHYNFS